MGGDTTSPHSPIIHSTEESSLDENFPNNPLSSLSGSDRFGTKVENISVDSEEFVRASSDIIDEMNKKQIRNVYMDVLKSYEELQFHKDHLEEAKNKILRYSYLW